MNNFRSRTDEVSSPRLLRVLLVDDSDLTRQACVRRLNSYGGICIVGQGADGQEGFLLAARLQPDLVITDLNMPQMDGFELVKLLRRKYPSMRSLLVSSNDGPVVQAASRQYGADGFIHKGHLFAELPVFLERLFPGHTRGAVSEADSDDSQPYPSKFAPHVGTAQLNGSKTNNEIYSHTCGFPCPEPAAHGSNQAWLTAPRPQPMGPTFAGPEDAKASANQSSMSDASIPTREGIQD